MSAAPDAPGFVLAGLKRGAAIINGLPLEKREVSDRADMLDVLRGKPTGRDGFVAAKALAYCIADGHPRAAEMRAWLLDRFGAALLTSIADDVRHHLGKRPDLGAEVNRGAAAIEIAREQMKAARR